MKKTWILGLALAFAPLAPAAADWDACGGTSIKQIATRGRNDVYAVTFSNQLLRYDGRTVSPVPGPALTYISVDSEGNLCGLDAKGTIHLRQGPRWSTIPGTLSQITRGHSRPGGTWGVNGAGTVHVWNNVNWGTIGGILSHLSIGSDDTLFGVNGAGHCFRYNGGRWDTVTADLNLAEVSVGSAAHVWALGRGGEIYRYNGRSFISVEGKLASLSVGYDGCCYGVTSTGAIVLFVERAARPAPPPPPPAPRPERLDVKEIRVSPPRAQCNVGESVAISAQAFDQHGRPYGKARLEFKATGGGRMDGSTFIAEAPGNWDIWVTHRKSGTSKVVQITVVEPIVCRRIVLTPSARQVHCGQQLNFNAVAYDQHGRPINVPIELSTEGDCGSFRGNVFHAGTRAGRYTLWARHRGSDVACSVEIEIVDPVILSLVTVENQVSRVRCGGTVRLELRGWDQYYRPMELDLSGLNFGCSAGPGSWDLATLTFRAPRRPGAYTVTVAHPSLRGVTATAYIYVHD